MDRATHEMERRLLRSVRQRDESQLLRICAELIAGWNAEATSPRFSPRVGWWTARCDGWRVNERRQFRPVEGLPVQVAHFDGRSSVSFLDFGRAELSWEAQRGRGTLLHKSGRSFTMEAEVFEPGAWRFRVYDLAERVVFEGRMREAPVRVSDEPDQPAAS